MNHDAAPVEHAEHPPTPMSLYYWIYVWLMALLVLTVWVAYIHMGVWALPIALTIAFVKAMMVIIYFMHMRYSAKLVWVWAIVSILWLMTMISSILTDVLMRGR